MVGCGMDWGGDLSWLWVSVDRAESDKQYAVSRTGNANATASSHIAPYCRGIFELLKLKHPCEMCQMNRRRV